MEGKSFYLSSKNTKLFSHTSMFLTLNAVLVVQVEVLV